MRYVNNKARSDQKGFSLIELLIVVVIIGVIAAIAIPNLLSARRSANEGSAVSAMRTLHGAQMTYASTVGNGNYAGGLAFSVLALQELGSTGARIIDDTLATGTKSGYNFVGIRTVNSATTPAQFAFSASPSRTTGATQTGTRRFGVATDGVIKSDTTLAQYGTLLQVQNAPPHTN